MTLLFGFAFPRSAVILLLNLGMQNYSIAQSYFHNQLRFQSFFLNQGNIHSLDTISYDNFIICSQSNGFQFSSVSPFEVNSEVIKVNDQGVTVWTKVYGDSITNTALYSVKQTIDHGLLMVGGKEIVGIGGSLLMIKTDSNGNIEWQKCLSPSGTLDASGMDFIALPNGDFIIAVQEYHYFDVARVDSLGNLLWVKNFDVGPELSSIKSIVKTFDNNFLLFGNIGDSVDNCFVIKIDSAGNSIWGMRYFLDQANMSCHQTTDSGFVVAGDWTVTGLAGVTVFKISKNGFPQWSKYFHGTTNPFYFTYGTDAVEDFDHGYLVTSAYGSGPPTYQNGVLLFKTDSIGNYVWSRRHYLNSGNFSGLIGPRYQPDIFLFGNEDGFNSMLRLNANGILNCMGNSVFMTDSAISFTNQVINPIVYSGNLTPSTCVVNVQTVIPIDSVICSYLNSGGTNNQITETIASPNPNAGKFSILSETDFSRVTAANVFDVLGSEISSFQFSIEGNKISFESKEVIPAGIYFIEIISPDKIFLTKVILQ